MLNSPDVWSIREDKLAMNAAHETDVVCGKNQIACFNESNFLSCSTSSVDEYVFFSYYKMIHTIYGMRNMANGCGFVMRLVWM